MIDGELTLLVLAGVGWLWWDSRGVAEQAVQIVRQRCEQAGVTLLNDTVSWKKVRLRRHQRSGRIRIQRTYLFEFTSDFRQRYQGEIDMLGRQLSHVDLGVYRVVEG